LLSISVNKTKNTRQVTDYFNVSYKSMPPDTVAKH